MRKMLVVCGVIVVMGAAIAYRRMNPVLIYNNEVLSTEQVLALRENGHALYCGERANDLFNLTLAFFDTQAEVDQDIAQRLAS